MAYGPRVINSRQQKCEAIREVHKIAARNCSNAVLARARVVPAGRIFTEQGLSYRTTGQVYRDDLGRLIVVSALVED